jgi:hypothetical protein
VARARDWKLRGRRFAHFGAFGRPEWRSWDFLWGRLDAVAHLGELLGASRDDISRLQRLVVAEDQAAAGDPTPLDDRLTAIAEELRLLHRETDREMFGAWRRQPGSTETAILLTRRVLLVVADQDSAVPPFVRRGGAFVLKLFGRDEDVDVAKWKDRGVRWISRGVRRRFWNRIEGMSP